MFPIIKMFAVKEVKPDGERMPGKCIFRAFLIVSLNRILVVLCGEFAKKICIKCCNCEISVVY